MEPESYPGAWQDSQRIISHTLEDVRSGSIVLLHVMYPSRSESMAAAAEEAGAEARGLLARLEAEEEVERLLKGKG